MKSTSLAARDAALAPAPADPAPPVQRSRIGLLAAGLVGLASLGGCMVVPVAPVPVGVGVTVRGRWAWVGGRRVWVRARY